MPLEITNKINVNAVVWLQSLPESEGGPSRRIQEDLFELSKKDGLPLHVLSIGSAADMAEALSALHQQAEKGLRPILHFDAHGHKDDGLLLSSGEYYGWDRLAERLRAINASTSNNLCCISASCYGLHLSKQIDVTKPAPAFILIAPEDKTTFGFLEDETVNFYRLLNETGNINLAFEGSLRGQMQMFNAERLLALGLARYMKTRCSGKAALERRERVLTQLLDRQGSDRSPDRVRSARRQIKKALKPDQAMVDHFAQKFLVGREASIKIAQLTKLAKGKP